MITGSGVNADDDLEVDCQMVSATHGLSVGWVLADARIADLGRSPVWAGKQVLLVYSRVDELAASGLTEADCFASRLAEAAEGANPEHQAAEIAELRRQRDAATDQLADLLAAHRALQASTSATVTDSIAAISSSRVPLISPPS